MVEEGVDPRSLAAPAREVSEEEYQEWVDQAFLADRMIKTTIVRTREDWWELAARFHDFHELQRWKPLGYEYLADWLGQPEVGYGRSTYDKLRMVWEQLVVLRGVNPDDIKDIDWTKAATVVAALRAGRVTLQQGLSDARQLSRSDLIDEYQPKPEEGPAEDKALQTDSYLDINPPPVDDEPKLASEVEPVPDLPTADEVRGILPEEVDGEVEPEWPEMLVRCPHCSAVLKTTDFLTVTVPDVPAE